MLTPDQETGRQLFLNTNCGIPACRDGSCPILSCESCHTLDLHGNPGSAAPGFFGTFGRNSFAFNPQLFKIPHLRNLYQKIGMFGMAAPPFGILPGDNDHQGDQVRGFGFLHDGSFDTGTLEEGKLKSETFKEAGTYSYICSIHPDMHGTVEVVAAG